MGTAVSLETSSIPELTEQQQIIFGENLNSMLNTASHWAGGVLDEGAPDRLAGPFLVNLALDPDYVEQMNNYNPDFEREIKPLIDYVSNLTPEEKNNYVEQALEDYGLNPGAPFNLAISYGETLVEYDPTTATSHATITIPRPTELTLQEGAEALITVNAITVNPSTLQAEEVSLPIADLSFETEESIVYGEIQKLRFTVPGTLLKWSEIRIAPGALVDAAEGDTSAKIYFTRGLTVNDQVMGMRALLPGEATAQEILPSNLYGGSTEEYLDPIPEADIADAMQAEAERTMALHVENGTLTQEEAEEISQDARLQGLHPVYQAAIKLGSMFRMTGGGHLIDSIFGENHSQAPVHLFFESDTEELNDIFNGSPPSLQGSPGLLWQLPVEVTEETPEGNINVFILSDRFKNGQEPVQVAATFMIHEMMVHDRFDHNQWNSLSEETFGNLIDIIIWSKMVQADPDLILKGTPETRFMNLGLYALINTLNPEGTMRHKGVGIQSKYAPEDYSIFPDHQMPDLPQMKSFMDLLAFTYAGQDDSCRLFRYTCVGR